MCLGWLARVEAWCLRGWHRAKPVQAFPSEKAIKQASKFVNLVRVPGDRYEVRGLLLSVYGLRRGQAPQHAAETAQGLTSINIGLPNQRKPVALDMNDQVDNWKVTQYLEIHNGI